MPREEFQLRIENLVKQVRSWIEPCDWVTQRYPKKLRDVDGQVYEVPALLMQKGPTKILLDPLAYDVPGSEGAVDLYLMPTYDDMASLYFRNGVWNMHYVFPDDSGDTYRFEAAESRPLVEGEFIRILDSIATHATPSF